MHFVYYCGKVVHHPIYWGWIQQHTAVAHTRATNGSKAVYYDTTVHHSNNTMSASYGTMISVPTVQCVR